VVVVVSGSGAVAVWIEAVTSHSAFVPWAVAASALSVLALVSIYMCFAVLNYWPTVRRRKRDTRVLPDRPIRGLGRGLGLLIPDIPGPLQIKLQDENWDLWHGKCWIVALKIRITNTTTDRAVRLKRFTLQSEIALGAQAKGVFQELHRRSYIYSPSLTPMDLRPDDSITGWFIRAAALPAQGGRPRCTFIVTDTLDDTYELDIPARPQKTHRMPSYYRPDDPEA
jgi:membrane protein implicated in regulation of membrane protease activity